MGTSEAAAGGAGEVWRESRDSEDDKEEPAGTAHGGRQTVAWRGSPGAMPWGDGGSVAQQRWNRLVHSQPPALEHAQLV